MLKSISKLMLVTTLLSAPVLAEENNHVLELVEAKVVHSEDIPVVIFDLDDTLFDSRTRKFQIFREFASQAEIKRDYPFSSATVMSLGVEDHLYGVEDTLTQVGVRDDEFVQGAKQHWVERFFTNTYVATDLPIKGAVEYVNRLHRKGAVIVYLTGRDIPNMEVGTRTSLIKHGFPIDEGDTHLFMKPDKKIADADYKGAAIEDIRELGKIVAVFENEPRNINLMAEAFPNATAVFLDTLHSSKPDVPNDGIEFIKHY